MSSMCPGFKAQGVRPTKCRKCFKDISEHNIDLGPVSTYSVYRIRRGATRSTLELDNLGSAANLTTLRYDTTPSTSNDIGYRLLSSRRGSSPEREDQSIPSKVEMTVTLPLPKPRVSEERQIVRDTAYGYEMADEPTVVNYSDEGHRSEKDQWEKEKKQLQEEVTTKAEEITSLESRITELEGSIEELKAKKRKTTDISKTKVNGVTQLEKQIKDKDVNIKELQKQVDDLSAEIKIIKSEKLKLSSSAQADQTTISKLKEEVASLEKNLKEKVSKLDSSSKNDEVKKMKEQLKKVQDENKELDNNLKTKASANSALEEKLKKLEETVDELSKKRKATLENNKTKMAMIEKLQKQLADTETTTKEFQKQMDDNKKQIKSITEERDTLMKESRRRGEKKDLISLETEKGKLIRDLEDSELIIRNLQEEVRVLNTNLKDKAAKMVDLSSESESNTKKIATQVRKLEEEKKELDKNLRKKMTEVSSLESKIKKLEEELNDSNRKKKQTADSSKELKDSIDKLQKEGKEKDAEIKDLKQEIEESRRDMKLMMTEKQKLLRDMDDNQYVVQSLKQDIHSLTKNLKGKSSELLDMSSKYETDTKKLTTQLKQLEGEKKDFEKNMKKKSDEVVSLENKVSSLEQKVEDLKKVKKQSSDGSKVSSDMNDALRKQLKEKESTIKGLMKENEDIKKEVKTLAQELEELHDTFREDQASEFRDLKRELELAVKDLRIKTFKLKKTEAYCEQLEHEKIEANKQMKEMTETGMMSGDKHRMKKMEDELNLAKEISMRLHSEIESLRADNLRLENDLKEAKNPSRLGFRRFFNSTAANGQQNKSGTSRNSLRGDGKLSPAPSLTSQQSFEKEKEYEEVVRNLYDTMEREKDLQEQLKYSEEESKGNRKKLAAMEQENEILMMQIRKLALTKGKIDEDSDDLNPEEMKLHLDLYEQEMSVLRNRTESLEKENESLQTELKSLQEKAIQSPTHSRVEIPELLPSSSPNVIYEYKIRLMEVETRDLRKKLVDREMENENLRTEVSIFRRKNASSKGILMRTQSLDREEAEFNIVSNKLQQQAGKRNISNKPPTAPDQETSLLRQKVANLESENERLSRENKKIQLKMSMMSQSHERLNKIGGSRANSQEKLKGSKESLTRSRESLTQSNEKVNMTRSSERLNRSIGYNSKGM